MFYKEILNAFNNAQGRINASITRLLEAQDLPLWNTIITYNEHKQMDSNGYAPKWEQLSSILLL